MPILDPNVRIVKLFDGHFQAKRLAPDRRVRVVQYGRLQPSFRRNSGSRDDAVVDGVAVAVDHRDGHLDVPRRRFAPALERAFLNGQVEVVPWISMTKLWFEILSTILAEQSSMFLSDWVEKNWVS